jgi:DNA-binding GntR family transcriptional regulator
MYVRTAAEGVGMDKEGVGKARSYDLPSLNGAETLPDRICSSLEEAILEGKIKPGDRLIEDDLASQFGISRGPIREAFRLMERDGWIRMVPRKGAMVNSISREDISEIYEVISVLEGLAARLFCERGQEEQVARLGSIYEEMEGAIKEGNLSRYSELNRAFHDVFICGCKNKKVDEIYGNFQKQIRWFQKLTLSSMGRPKVSLREHRGILDAFIERDPKKAEQRTREHMDRAGRSYGKS